MLILSTGLMFLVCWFINASTILITLDWEFYGVRCEDILLALVDLSGYGSFPRPLCLLIPLLTGIDPLESGNFRRGSWFHCPFARIQRHLT